MELIFMECPQNVAILNYLAGLKIIVLQKDGKLSYLLEDPLIGPYRISKADLGLLVRMLEPKISRPFLNVQLLLW
jgi:hypothetical protein